jgi:hypothetical protein
MDLTHLGHACLLLETAGTRLLFDPGVFSSFDGVRDIDAVLVTHQHPDHIDLRRLASLLAANPGALLYVDAGTAATAEGLPPGYTVVRPGDILDLGPATIEVTGGLHAAVYGDVPGCANAAYLVDDGAFFHPGDSLRPRTAGRRAGGRDGRAMAEARRGSRLRPRHCPPRRHSDPRGRDHRSGQVRRNACRILPRGIRPAFRPGCGRLPLTGVPGMPAAQRLDGAGTSPTGPARAMVSYMSAAAPGFHPLTSGRPRLPARGRPAAR